MASWWLLREVEVAGMRLGDARFETVKGRPRSRTRPPVSETDTGSRGCERTLTCYCAQGMLVDGRYEVEASRVCFACELQRQVDWNVRHTGIRRQDPEALDIPMLPSADGGVPRKEALV